MLTNVPVTDADRDALEALRPFMAPLAPTASMLILEAIARARAEGIQEGRDYTTRLVNERAFAEGAASEREARIAAIKKACPRAHTYASENADVYRAFDAGAEKAMTAIRARGEGGKA